MITNKDQAMKAFEQATVDLGLSYEKVDVEGEVHYTDYITGTQFGMFWLGWKERESCDPHAAWMKSRGVSGSSP